MKHLLQHLLDTGASAYDTIVYAGAGTASSLDSLRQLAARRLILMEPNPQLAADLRNKLRVDKGEELLEVGLSADSGKKTLHIYNNARESSLIDTNGATEHFPNLRLVRQIDIECKTLSDLAGHYGVEQGVTNLLILEITGMEGPLLAKVDEDVLQLFSNLIVRTAEVPLYGNDSHEQAIVKRLAEIGFKLQLTDPGTLFPHKELLFRRDDEWVVKQRLNVRIRSQEELIQSLQKQLEALRSAQDELQRTNESLIQTAAKEKADLVADRETKAKLVAERQAQVEQLTKARDEEARFASERQESVEALKKEKAELAADRDAKAKLAEERKREGESLMNARDEQAHLANERQAQVEQLKKAREEQAKLASERQACVEALKKEKAELGADRDAKTKLAADRQMTIDTLNAELKKANALLEERASKITALETQREDLEFRQSLLNQEMIKAEAQIDLIKDVLLREPGI